jgi:hypothetical protein
VEAVNPALKVIEAEKKSGRLSPHERYPNEREERGMAAMTIEKDVDAAQSTRHLSFSTLNAPHA